MIDDKTSGVAMNEPHPFTADAIQKSVNTFLEARPEAKGGALLQVTMKDGVNLVVARKVKDNFVIDAWIGKKWSEPLDGGVQAVLFF
jgi:hypothetical protein